VLGEIATEASDLGMTLFSALNKTGLEDVAVTLRQWVLDAPKIDMPDVPPLDDEFGDEFSDEPSTDAD
jgi:GTP-binding protein